MSSPGDETLTDETLNDEGAADEVEEQGDDAQDETGGFRMSLSVEIEEIGPCRKKVRVVVPRTDLEHFRTEAIGELSESAAVPGFRPGHVPDKLIERRFKTEIGDQVKQNVLVTSLEQLAEENNLDPINEPNIEVEELEIPDEGDFEYQFEVEVRPEFDLPDYKGLEIERAASEVTDADVEKFKTRFLSQYGERKATEEPAATDDYVTVDISFTHNGDELHSVSGQTLQIRPRLGFQDAELEGFDKLMEGVKAGDQKDAEFKVSLESENIEMRGESVTATFDVKEVRRLEIPELTREVMDRVGVESEEDLAKDIRETLERQATFQQRQATREQVLQKITASADWDLPEDLVLRQTENALRREILEMQQAGFTQQQIQARENTIRQQAVTTTRQALKEHFVLDKIATQENIECDPSDIEAEILMMSMQRGESPRRVRARLQKSGMIENLDAQIRERKAVDFILDSATFKDVPAETAEADEVEAVPISVCGTMLTTEVRAEVEDADDDSE